MARIAIIAIAALALAGCATTPVDDGRVHVVASTNVYGSIAEAIGGEFVAVTSLIDSAAHDPHSFEASAQDQLAIAKADLVIENGGGYDPFIDTLLEAASADAVVVSASEASGLLEVEHDHEEGEEEHDEHGHDEHIEGFNEHVWYNLPGMQSLAAVIADQLATIDPTHSSTYAANRDRFTEQVTALGEQVAGIGEGKTAAITEPVPLYLLELAGFENVTPEEFSEAIEEGTDVPPAVLADLLDTVGSVALLAYNSQTASPETEQVKAAAEEAGVPVVEFAETLPDGEDYISWMTSNVAALAAL